MKQRVTAAKTYLVAAGRLKSKGFHGKKLSPNVGSKNILKSWWKMVMKPLVESVKIHQLKQTKDIHTPRQFFSQQLAPEKWPSNPIGREAKPDRFPVPAHFSGVNSLVNFQGCDYFFWNLILSSCLSFMNIYKVTSPPPLQYHHPHSPKKQGPY